MAESLMLKTVFDWDHFLLYLSGPIDFDREGGRNWRDEWTDGLVEIGFKKHRILNPCRKPLKGAHFNLDNESEIMNKHRSRREWKDLCEVMGEIVHVDLRMTDKSDIILVNFPMVGKKHFSSIHEKFTRATDSMTTADDSNGAVESFNELYNEAARQRIPTFGTMHEIVLARQQRKPVYVVWEGGKEKCSGWLMWLVGHQNIFSTFEEVKTRLENISKGKTAFNARDWLLLDLDGV